MKENREKKVLANIAVSMANVVLSSAANSRCVFVYHQPFQPKEVKRFRKL